MSRFAAWMTCVLLLVVAGCTDRVADAAGQVRQCPAKLALFGPFSGASADLGQYIHDGVQLAVEQYDAARPACPVSVVDMDSQGDPKQAPAFAQQVVADPRILGVVGPAFSGESEAADPLLNQGGVATITASATETALSNRGWSTFHRIIGNDAKQGPAAGRYIAAVMHARKVFVIDDTEAYGRGLAAEVTEVLGDRVVQSASIPPQQRAFVDVVSQIRAARPDVVFFGGYYEEAGDLLSQMHKAGVTATLVSGDAVKDEGFLRRAGAAAEGTVITCPCRPPQSAGDGFAARYRARFGVEPGTYSAEAYDAATVFLRGIQAGKLTRPAMASFVSGYAGTGVTGPIRFTPTGELVDSSVTVWAYRVAGGVIVPDRPIPSS